MLFESYQEDFFTPAFVEIREDQLAWENGNSSLDEEYLSVLNDSAHLVNSQDTLVDDETRKNNRLFEKEFFKEIVEIVVYLILFFIIIAFNYDHTYIDQKVYSNENLKNIISKNTSWNKVDPCIKIKSLSNKKKLKT